MKNWNTPPHKKCTIILISHPSGKQSPCSNTSLAGQNSSIRSLTPHSLPYCQLININCRQVHKNSLGPASTQHNFCTLVLPFPFRSNKKKHTQQQHRERLCKGGRRDRCSEVVKPQPIAPGDMAFGQCGYGSAWGAPLWNMPFCLIDFFPSKLRRVRRSTRSIIILMWQSSVQSDARFCIK